jgi:hypothetical protein
VAVAAAVLLVDEEALRHDEMQVTTTSADSRPC